MHTETKGAGIPASAPYLIALEQKELCFSHSQPPTRCGNLINRSEKTASYTKLKDPGGYENHRTALRFTCRLYNEEDCSTEAQVFIKSKL